tara:strand:- start:3801 stop:4154 length:354 start_codon:yes stop_codon:yes gene_type:complete
MRELIFDIDTVSGISGNSRENIKIFTLETLAFFPPSIYSSHDIFYNLIFCKKVAITMNSKKSTLIIQFKCPECKQLFGVGQPQIANLAVVQCRHCQAVLRLKGKDKCIVEASSSTLA